MHLITRLIDENIDGWIEKSKHGKAANGSSKGMSHLQRYIKEANNRDNKSIYSTIKKRRILHSPQ